LARDLRESGNVTGIEFSLQPFESGWTQKWEIAKSQWPWTSLSLKKITVLQGYNIV
jgi:hypothetical protein